MRILTLFILILTTLTLASAQDIKPGPITAAQVTSAKALVIKNLEKDTYLKADGLVFDRDDDKAPYVFKFSDGVERRIYLFRIVQPDEMKQLGTLAVFTTPQNGNMQKICIPSPVSDKAVWGQYIDDLKDGDKQANGLAVCLAFVLSKEFGGGTPAGSTTSAEKEKNEFCFPADAWVRMADGMEKQISEIKTGERLAGPDGNPVQSVQIHEGRFTLTSVWVQPLAPVWASRESTHPLIQIEATANHPVLTPMGRRTLGGSNPGDFVFVEDAGTYQLAQVTSVLPNSRTVDRVYNLMTERGLYEVNGVVVLDK